MDKIIELKVANAANAYYYMHFENYDGLVTLYLSDDGVNYTRKFTGVAYKFGVVAYKNYRIYRSTENTVQLDGSRRLLRIYAAGYAKRRLPFKLACTNA